MAYSIIFNWGWISSIYPKNFFIINMPVVAAMIPPTLLAKTYPVAFGSWPSITHFATSTENVLKVVKDPQNPTPIMSLALGDKPLNLFFGVVTDEENAGVPARLPKANEPAMLMPAVCQPWNAALLVGSFAIH